MATQETRSTWTTPPAIARLLGVNTDRVRRWIQSGKLSAVNLSDATRPRWRVSQEALDQFLAARSNQVAKRPTRRRRRPSNDGVIQFFK